jgi:undecaprenyl-diphosphatase
MHTSQLTSLPDVEIWPRYPSNATTPATTRTIFNLLFMNAHYLYLNRRLNCPPMTKSHRPERQVLLALMLIAGALLVVVLFLPNLDNGILLAFRTGADPAGPIWVEELARDITALGSSGVLALLVTASVLFLFLARQKTDAWTMLAATIGGVAVVVTLKGVLARSRPDEILRSVYVSTPSFPSGHTMMSTVTYLTLGALMARELRSRTLKTYVVLLALFVSGLVGVSRIYLGVHWPSDVLAGWSFGAAWALLCWTAAERAGKAKRQP